MKVAMHKCDFCGKLVESNSVHYGINLSSNYKKGPGFFRLFHKSTEDEDYTQAVEMCIDCWNKWVDSINILLKIKSKEESIAPETKRKVVSNIPKPIPSSSSLTE